MRFSNNMFKPLKLLVLSFLTLEPKRLPNVGYLSSGYDIYKGNPRETGSVDPGFRLEPVFNLTLDGGTTSDGRYILPKGVVAEQCISCMIDFNTNYIKTVHDYSKELDKSVSGEVSGFWGKFSASRSYKEIYKSTKEQEKKYTMNEANCALYCMTGLTFLPRELSDNFKAAVELLTSNSDDSIYHEFINAFGTHYIYSMKMGSNFGILTEFTKSAWEEMNSRSIDVSAAASTSALIKAGVEVKDSEKIEQAKIFNSYSERSNIHSTGASLPTSGKINDWIPHALTNPMPQAYELNNIYNLLNSKYFPDDKDIDLKRNNLKEAINKYCLQLKDQGLVISCSEDDDPQLPEPKIISMYNCPVNYQRGYQDQWTSYGCIGQLSPIDDCQSIVLKDWKGSGATSTISFPCSKLDIDLSNSLTYACPIDVQLDGKDPRWYKTHFGCLGQLSLTNECETSWYGGTKKLPCNRFDASKQTIYKCPFNPYTGANNLGQSNDIGSYWVSVGCLGQYSHLNKCYNYWYNRFYGSLFGIHFNCEVYSPSIEQQAKIKDQIQVLDQETSSRPQNKLMTQQSQNSWRINELNIQEKQEENLEQSQQTAQIQQTNLPNSWTNN